MILNYKFHGEPFIYEVDEEECVKELLLDMAPKLTYPEAKKIYTALKDFLNVEDYLKANEQSLKALFLDNAFEEFNNEFFICSECGDAYSIEEKCTKHNMFGHICKNCCELCRIEKAYWMKRDIELAEALGK